MSRLQKSEKRENAASLPTTRLCYGKALSAEAISPENLLQTSQKRVFSKKGSRP